MAEEYQEGCDNPVSIPAGQNTPNQGGEFVPVIPPVESPTENPGSSSSTTPTRDPTSQPSGVDTSPSVPSRPPTTASTSQSSSPQNASGGESDDSSSTPPAARAGRGWTEPPTQHGRVKGKKIPERKPECDCEGSEGSGDNDSQFFKPHTIYPTNHVTETESGHIEEIDDTPGSERLSRNHRSGTFEEIHPNGDTVKKFVRDLYLSILRNLYWHVDGYCDITIDKALKIRVNTDELKSSPDASVSFDVHIGKGANVNLYVEQGDVNVQINKGNTNLRLKEGDVNIRQDKGNYNHFLNGDFNLECTGHMHLVCGGDLLQEVGLSRQVLVAGKLNVVEHTNPEGQTLHFSKGDLALNVEKNFKITAKDSDISAKASLRLFGDSKVHVGSSGTTFVHGGKLNLEGENRFDIISTNPIHCNQTFDTATTKESFMSPIQLVKITWNTWLPTNQRTK